MKRIIFILLFISSVFYAETDLNIEISSFVGIGLSNANYLYNENQAFFKAKTKLSEDLSFVGSFGINYIPYPQAENSSKEMLQSSDYLYPFSFYLEESYVSANNFILDRLDFVVGKQRISWGKADKINPTDVLNPQDLTKITDLAKKIPTFAFNLTYYFPFLSDYGAQFVWEPYPNQSLLAFEFIDKKLTKKIKEKMLGNVTSVEIDENWNGEVKYPEFNLTNSVIGGKIFGKVLGFDFSLNAVRRQNDIPYVKEIYLKNSNNINFPTMSETNVTVLSKSYQMEYHKETEIGFDLEKDWGIFVNRFELAIFIPDETKTITYTTSITPIPIPPMTIVTNTTTNEEIILKEPYVKWVIGLDKNFDGGWYINFQIAHGLFMERGYKDERLQDYFTFNIEKSFFDDKLKFKLFGIVNTDTFVDRFKDSDIIKSFVDNSAIMGNFEIVYSPLMGLDFKVGICGIDGKGEATLTQYKDYDMIYLEVASSF